MICMGLPMNRVCAPCKCQCDEQSVIHIATPPICLEHASSKGVPTTVGRPNEDLSVRKPSYPAPQDDLG